MLRIEDYPEVAITNGKTTRDADELDGRCLVSLVEIDGNLYATTDLTSPNEVWLVVEGEYAEFYLTDGNIIYGLDHFDIPYKIKSPKPRVYRKACERWPIGIGQPEITIDYLFGTIPVPHVETRIANTVYYNFVLWVSRNQALISQSLYELILSTARSWLKKFPRES